MEQNTTNFREIVKQIEEFEILLPDFQREFVWTDEEQQKKIVASVLARMPIGSILLLESKAEEYSSKIVGCRNKQPSVSADTMVQFLLDGQQRVTVLTNVFSNAIHNQCDKISDLTSTKLKRRFFLKIPKWRDIFGKQARDEISDLFGVYDLVFKYQNPDMEEPGFLSSDILKYVECYDFQKDDRKPYNPKSALNTELDDFCVGNREGYLIPLFLLVPSKGDKVAQVQLRYQRIVNNISNKIKDEIVAYYTELMGDEKEKFIDNILNEEVEYNEIKKDYFLFEDYLQARASVWENNLKKYLDSCVEKISLNRILVKADQRARAIDIYENLNKGGVSLNTFDLVMARVAKVSKENYFNRIVGYMKAAKKYHRAVLPEHMDKIIGEKVEQGKYNATMQTNCYSESKSTISPKYIDAFLDVLSLYCYNKELKADRFKLENIKKDRILKIEPQDIHEYTEKVCIALDRALFFFQTRCGIRNITEINYSLMLVLVATLFMKDDIFGKKEKQDKIEAWYWSSIFSGEYDKDQNITMISHLQQMVKMFENNDIQWIVGISEYVLKGQNFSDKSFLLMEKAGEERYPKIILRHFVCQYFLARTYPDMFEADKLISVFCKEADELEEHHIVPLGTVKKVGETTAGLRRNPANICNSPLNFVFITKTANREISDEALDSYVAKITKEAKSSLYIPTNYTSTTDIKVLDNVKAILSQRFDYFAGILMEDIGKLLS